MRADAARTAREGAAGGPKIEGPVERDDDAGGRVRRARRADELPVVVPAHGSIGIAFRGRAGVHATSSTAAEVVYGDHGALIARDSRAASNP